MKAICFRGPAGVGKTTLAYKVGRAIKEKAPECNNLGYISGDMFAHVSFDCQYNEGQIDLKYVLIRQAIDELARQRYTIIFDDTFERPSDYVEMVKHLITIGYEVHLFFLFAPLKVAIKRNNERFWKERISESRVKKLHIIHSTYSHIDETVIDTSLPIERTCQHILSILNATGLT